MSLTRRFLFLLLGILICPVVLLCQIDTSSHAKAGLAKQSLKWLKTEADPKKDLAHALAKGDTSFIAVQGYDVLVPGVDDYFQQYSKQYSVHIIPGTGDVYSTSEELELQDKAITYAKAYNLKLLQVVRSRMPQN